MAPLVGYESSDDEEEVQVPNAKPLETNEAAAVEGNGHEGIKTSALLNDPVRISSGPAELAAAEKELPPSSTSGSGTGDVYGPMPQPEGASSAFPPLEEAPIEDGAPVMAPSSPYSASRALLRDLTLPSVPNMDIPPSPPGSPPPATNKKFEQFLELKKKGVHFNSKIAQSPALKNPGLMDKLMRFVEIDQQDQYRSTLSTDVWDPTGFPRHAYKEQLRKSQAEVGQARARNPGDPVDFVSSRGDARVAEPTSTSRAEGVGKPGSVQAPNPGKRKSRFDT